MRKVGKDDQPPSEDRVKQGDEENVHPLQLRRLPSEYRVVIVSVVLFLPLLSLLEHFLLIFKLDFFPDLWLKQRRRRRH